MAISPTAEGFRAAFRRPSFTFAEIMWRWVAGATVTAVFLFGLIEFLDTLPVTGGDVFFLRTRQPFLVWQAILHILRGSLTRGVLPLIMAATLLTLFWMVAASVGRLITVPAIVEYFRRQRLNNESFGPFLSLFRLNFLRATVVLSGLLGLAGAAIVAGFFTSGPDPRPGVAFVVFIPIALLVCFICWALNWLLSLAELFAVLGGSNSVVAISDAIWFCRERTAAVFAVSTWTGLLHFAAFLFGTTAVSTLLGVGKVLPWRLVALGMIFVTLAYFAFADWLYMVRLSGYVCIAEMPEELAAPPVPPPIAPPVQTTIDHDELILSDIPGLPAET